MIPQYNIRGQDEFDDLVVICDRNFFRLGGTWAEYGVTWDQLDSRVGQRVARGAPRLWDWVAARARAWFGPAA